MIGRVGCRLSFLPVGVFWLFPLRPPWLVSVAVRRRCQTRLWVDQAALDGPEDPFAGADGCVGLHAGIEQRPIFFADEMSNGLVRPVLNGSEQGF